MADEAEVGSRPGRALSINTAAGTELATDDIWSARIIVTAAAVSGVTLVGGLTPFFLKKPELVLNAVELALKAWGKVVDVSLGSVVVKLNCGTKEKFLKFVNDFEERKVKDAMDKEFNKIGFSTELKLSEEAYNLVFEMRKESVITKEEKTIIIQKVHPSVSHDEKKLEEDRVQKAKLAEDTQGDSQNKEDISFPTQQHKKGEPKSRPTSTETAGKRSPSPVHTLTSKKLKEELTGDHGEHLVPTKEKMSLTKQSENEDVKMDILTQQYSEFKKDPLLDIKVVKRGAVTDKGCRWNLWEAAASVTFHRGAVPKPFLFTCSLWNPTIRSPPIGSNELLVSNVIELSHDGPPDLEFSGDGKGSITVALLHSACDLKGYEVVIKQLVDPDDNEWKDLETSNKWNASAAENPKVSHWPQFVEATCTLEHCSSFAAVWRLKSFTFSRHTSVAPEFTCVVPDYPDLSVEIPLNSVPDGQDFSLTLKVQEFPSSEVKGEGMLVGPVLHISSSQNIEHLYPVTIKLPLTLRESRQDFAELSNEVIRILYLDSESKSQTWTDITDQLEEPVLVTDGKVAFKVNHFCRFCPVCVLKEGLDNLMDSIFRLFSKDTSLQTVNFLTCLCKTFDPDTYGLLLYCYPNWKQADVDKKIERYDAPYKGQGTSGQAVCIRDEILVSPLELNFVRESQRTEKIVLRYREDGISDNSDKALLVRVDSKSSPTVKFFKDEELQNPSKLLCEVPFVHILTTSPVFRSTGVASEVSSEERPAFLGVKQGTPTYDELELLGADIGNAWMKLGRRLEIQDPKLDELNNADVDLSEKGYRMLRHWKQEKGLAATYQVLCQAIQHRLVNRQDLAEKYCCEQQ